MPGLMHFEKSVKNLSDEFYIELTGDEFDITIKAPESLNNTLILKSTQMSSSRCLRIK